MARLILCFVLLGDFFAPHLISAQSDWYLHETALFKIRYHRTDQNLVDDLSKLLNEEYGYLSADLRLKLRTPIRVYLSPTEMDFAQATGHYIPHWGEGVADPRKGIIVLKSPNLTHNFKRLPKLVRHELTHILVGQATTRPETIPRWFHEGLAIYFSYDEEFAAGESISKALIGDALIPLAEIDEVLKFHKNKARLAYEESFSAVLFLEEQFGYEGILALLQEIQSNKRFERAFADVFGIGLADFELDWLRFAEKKYRWSFLLDFETFLWIFMLAVFILVVIVVRIRNRRVLKRWETEERMWRAEEDD